MTAGNLFCGAAAIISIFEGMMPGGDALNYYHAILFILGACFFDLLDGRMARLTGGDSDFGREFDSIADIVSFGVAPALLVYNIVLAGIPDGYGYFIAFIYLLCGAMRLARFNCITHAPGVKPDSNFRGFPIPAAAGVIASITLLLLKHVGGGSDDIQVAITELGALKHVLWVLMLLLSYMMFSDIRYPSFKGLNLRTKRSLPWVFVAIVLVFFTVRHYSFMPAILFVSYLLYGFARPWVSKSMRRKIEIELEVEPDEEPDSAEKVAEIPDATTESAS